MVKIKKGEYVGDVKYRKILSKRLRSLGLNECKTYTLTSPDMAASFRYEDKKQIVLPNPMSVEKSIIRTSLIPSLISTYEYNKSRKVTDVMIYEISKTYDADYIEDTKVAVLMKGNYIINLWQNLKVTVDFYTIKGILENILEYLGFKNRYSLEISNIPDMHPGMSATVLLDREPIGIIGRVHPSKQKDDIFVLELSMTKMMNKVIKPIKFKAANKYPKIVKDMAFIVKKTISANEIINQIRKSGGRLLENITVFDVYEGENVLEDEKSIAFTVTFSDPTRTLSDEEVMTVFYKIIGDIEQKFNATLRNK